MAIAGFRKITSDRYDMRGSAYTVIRADGKWTAYTVNAGNPHEALCSPVSQKVAADRAQTHRDVTAPAQAVVGDDTPKLAAALARVTDPLAVPDFLKRTDTAKTKAARAQVQATAAEIVMPPPAPCAPKVKHAARTRVQVTLEALARDEGVTVAELAALFATEFDGNGKLSTARQAMHKVPAKHGMPVTKGTRRAARASCTARALSPGPIPSKGRPLWRPFSVCYTLCPYEKDNAY